MKKVIIFSFFFLSITFTYGQSIDCSNNLIINGSFNSFKGQDVTATPWQDTLTPDINDENGFLQTTLGYNWTGIPIASNDDSTWQNLFGAEYISQSVNVITGQPYKICFEYAAQGIVSGSLIFNDPVGIKLYINNVLEFSTPLDSSQYTWEKACYSFIANTSSVEILFLPSSQQYIGIDGVCLVKEELEGLDDINKNNEIEIFPNPFYKETNIKSNINLNNATLKVYNSIGQNVIEIKDINTNSVKLSREKLSAGLYFLQITQDRKVVANKKLIILD
ncbi:MAG: T9SS type A sorting domain-containing protein [Chitinophagaceae bacterium]|nr:T9SS type A sorting domain-containing protein [Chitinophagaceae bacterium]